MSSLNTNLTAFMGAAFLGVIGAATVYIVEHWRHEKRRQAMAQELSRLDSEVSVLRRDLEDLIKKQSEKSQSSRHKSKGKKLKKRSNSASSMVSDQTDYLTSTEYNSSDLEFYDVTDDETDTTTESLKTILEKLDILIDGGNDLKDCLLKLLDLCLENPQHPDLLWRIGKVHYKIQDQSSDEEEKKRNIAQGIEACESALKANNNSAEAHKWLAILIGSRSDFQPMKERIEDGQLFKKHVDFAISINPSDPSLHHMLGRFCYEVACLKWYERKVASALFAEPPSSTYDEALEHFLKAEELATHHWRENKLELAKCYFALSKYEEGLHYLDMAKLRENDREDEKLEKEINQLLEKYSSYR